MKQHLKNDDQSVDRAMKLFEDLFNDSTLSNTDLSIIGSKSSHQIDQSISARRVLENLLNALNLNKTNERYFNERLLVCLGFVKVIDKRL